MDCLDNVCQCLVQTIRDTIPRAEGIEDLELSKASFDPNQQFPACMEGKAHQQIRPQSLEHTQLPLERVCMDIMSSLVRCIEGFNY